MLRKALLHPGEQADRQVLIPAQHGPQVVGGLLGIAVAALLQDLVVEGPVRVGKLLHADSLSLFQPYLEGAEAGLQGVQLL